MKLKITKNDRLALKKVFKNFGRKKTDEEIFYDLCFCICAPQTTFKKNREVINFLKDLDFYGVPLLEFDKFYVYSGYNISYLERILKPVRFYRNKAKYLIEAKTKFPEILNVISFLDKRNVKSIYGRKSYEIREWFVKNIKGLGMKAASHFLRNLGDTKLAIIDTHIIKFLARSEEEPYKTELLAQFRKMVTKVKGYEALEVHFRAEADDYKLSVAELDILIWSQYARVPLKEVKY